MSIKEEDKQAIFDIALRTLVTYVSAPTGSGKTVTLPIYFISKATNIYAFVSIPTIVSVESAFGFLNSKYSNNGVIGYAANTGKKGINYTNDTKLIYATTGHIKNKILDDVSMGVLNFGKNKTDALYLFIDEVHDTSFNTSLIVYLVNYAIKKKLINSGFRLVLMSATPRYFDFSTKSIQKYEIPMERRFSVEVRYLEYTPKMDKVNNIIINTIVKEHKNIINHILVFLPGKYEIDYVYNSLTSFIERDYILRLYSGVNPNIISNLETKKIILSTNVAESSITIDNVGLVIDSLLEKVNKEPIIDSSFKLVTDYISKNSAEQRKGRTGRTNNGVCIRMCKEDFFETLNKDSLDEMERLSLHNVVLELLIKNLDPFEVIPEKYHEKVNRSIFYLINLNLINKDTRVVSRDGWQVHGSPFGIKNTLLIINSINMMYEMVIVMSFIEFLSLQLIKEFDIVFIENNNINNLIEYIVIIWDDFMDSFADIDSYYKERKKYDMFIRRYNINRNVFRDMIDYIKKGLELFSNSRKRGKLTNHNNIKNYLLSKLDILIPIELNDNIVIDNKLIKSFKDYSNDNIQFVISLSAVEVKDKIVIKFPLVLSTGNIPKKKKIKGKGIPIRYGFGGYFIKHYEEEEYSKNELLSFLN